VRRGLLAALLVVVCAVAVAAAPAAGAAPCSRASATAAVLASTLPKRWKDKVTAYAKTEGISELLCRDATGDGRPDMTVVFYSGGTAGDVGWVVFRRAGTGWKLALQRLQGYKIRVAITGGDPVESQPVYRRDDANCCPTGGVDHTRFHWNGLRFAVARAWHTRN
jgi:hypothetical protein